MSQVAFEIGSPVPAGLPPERAWRWCVLATLRALRRSVRRRRPISLPNLLRLYRRKYAEIAGGLELHGDVLDQLCEAGISWLSCFYLENQPFGTVDWRRWRHALRRFPALR